MILAATGWSVLILSLIHGMVEMVRPGKNSAPRPAGEVYVPKHDEDLPGW